MVLVKAPPRPTQSKCKQVVLVKAPPRPTQSKCKQVVLVKAPPRPTQSECKQVVLVKAPPRPTQSKYKRAGGTGQGTTPRGLCKASACKHADGITSTCAEQSLYMCDIVRYHFAKAWLACARMRRNTFESRFPAPPDTRPQSSLPGSFRLPGCFWLLPLVVLLLLAPALLWAAPARRFSRMFLAPGGSRSPLLPAAPGCSRLLQAGVRLCSRPLRGLFLRLSTFTTSRPRGGQRCR